MVLHSIQTIPEVAVAAPVVVKEEEVVVIFA